MSLAVPRNSTTLQSSSWALENAREGTAEVESASAEGFSLTTKSHRTCTGIESAGKCTSTTWQGTTRTDTKPPGATRPHLVGDGGGDRVAVRIVVQVGLSRHDKLTLLESTVAGLRCRQCALNGYAAPLHQSERVGYWLIDILLRNFISTCGIRWRRRLH